MFLILWLMPMRITVISAVNIKVLSSSLRIISGLIGVYIYTLQSCHSYELFMPFSNLNICHLCVQETYLWLGLGTCFLSYFSDCLSVWAGGSYQKGITDSNFETGFIFRFFTESCFFSMLVVLSWDFPQPSYKEPVVGLSVVPFLRHWHFLLLTTLISF